ncbi:hypothetical protein LXA43DRAFT_1116233 [Ganoderma leucocontextum]|nr:hypothetical protein LXA43DRAFT_1116233 [Ganoderma leucocontextum]
MSQEPTYTIAALPRPYSQSTLNVLQSFMDRLGQGLPADAESLEVAQLSNNLASLKIAEPGIPAVSPHLTAPELVDPRPQDPAEAMRLARALAAKIQHHLRKSAPIHHSVLLDLKVYLSLSSLVFKPDGKERACERGAREVEGNFLTLEMTHRLIRLVRDHVPHDDIGGRFLTGIILLRLAAVLSKDTQRICVHTDYPIRSVQLDDNPSHSFGGVVDYVLANYSATQQLHSPGDALLTPGFRKLGSANIFVMESVAELKHGIPECILTTASWCRRIGGEEAMRGAATNGECWIFFAYKRDAETSYYARSNLVQVWVNEDLSNVNMILGILIDWVENMGVCDAFEYFKTPSDPRF